MHHLLCLYWDTFFFSAPDNKPFTFGRSLFKAPSNSNCLINTQVKLKIVCTHVFYRSFDKEGAKTLYHQINIRLNKVTIEVSSLYFSGELTGGFTDGIHHADKRHTYVTRFINAHSLIQIWLTININHDNVSSAHEKRAFLSPREH